MDFILASQSAPIMVVAVVATAALGGLMFVLAYWWVTSPSGELKKLNVNRIYYKALSLIEPNRPIKIERILKKNQLLPSRANECHFANVGQKINATVAKEKSAANVIRERLPGTILDVEYNVVFEYPQSSLQNGFALCETSNGKKRIVSSKDLPYCLCFKADDGAWHVKNEGSRRAIFDEDGQFIKKEYIKNIDAVSG